MRGQPQKANSRNPNPIVHHWIEVPNIPFDGPSLDSILSRLWNAETLAWWETVRTLPHAALWVDADWMFAARTALLVDDPDATKPTLAGQITRREAAIGMTDSQRRQNRIRYVESAEAEAEKPADAPVADVRRLFAV